MQRILEEKEANDIGVLRINPVLLLETGGVLTVTGSLQGIDDKTTLNGIRILSHPSSSGAWVVSLPTDGGTGSLRMGTNLVRLADKKGRIIDSSYVWRTTDPREYRLALEERRLVDAFVHSRSGDIAEDARVVTMDLFLDKSFLRRRLPQDPIGVRVNKHGERLSIRLLTSPSPPVYGILADVIRQQWASLGVEVHVDIPSSSAIFEERLLRRDYDVLLFGQSLLDNLDSYPYWHSSGIQKHAEQLQDLRLDAYNLSQYTSFSADSLLEVIRSHASDSERQDSLHRIRDVLKRDVPAVFLYTPLYTFAYTKTFQGIELGLLSLHSDRFLALPHWHVKQRREFASGRGWFSFFPWLFSLQ